MQNFLNSTPVLTISILFISGTFSCLFAQIILGHHPLGKMFLRGKGLPDKEFRRIDCLKMGRSWAFHDLDSFLKDPRLSKKQREMIFSDLVHNSEICPITGQADIGKTTHALITTSALNLMHLLPQIMDKNGKWVNPKFVDELLNYILLEDPLDELGIYAYASAGDTTFEDGVISLLLYKKNTKEVFWKHLNQLIEVYENNQLTTHGQHGYYVRGLELLETLLKSPLVSSEDINRLAYHKYSWVRQVATSSPACKVESRVASALLDAADASRLV